MLQTPIPLPEIKSVRCLKGSHHHGVFKDQVYPVLSISMDEYFTFFITLQLTDRTTQFEVGFRSSLTNPHGFIAHTGDPTKVVKLVHYT